jgi:cyclohexa-1,5-dienecarbonyl-CoA hydratase
MTAIRWTCADGVGRLTLDHPPLNILTRAILTEYRTHLARAAGEAALRVVVLEAAGQHFSAGADVSEHLPGQWEALIPEFLATIAQLDAFPVPVIAAVQGRCLGGGFEFVLSADVVVAADDVAFGQPEIVLGVTPPAACALLPDHLSASAAAALIYGGDPITADDALRLGLVWQVVPHDDLAFTAQALAARMARHSSAALRAAKAALKGDRLADRQRRLALAGAHYADDVMRTHDAVEGLTAFLAKRRPVWSHS